jgi:hypothetical protein
LARKTIRKPPKEFTIPFIDGPITVRPLSALRYGEIDERFPVDPQTKRRQSAYAFFAAVMSATIVEPDGTPSFDETAMRTEFDADDFWALWDVVGVYLGLKDKEGGDAPKDSPPANDSPTGSRSPSAKPTRK